MTDFSAVKKNLEARGFRSAVFEALLTAAGASGSLGK